MDNQVSRSERELLKALYRLSREGTEAHTSEVARRLSVTPGTITAGIKRLADRQLAIHRPYHGVELTAEGRVLAVSVIRRHRIIERFLSDFLGYEWQEADRLAMTFEHQMPQEVEDRIFERLGQPASCPHGFPIPARESRDVPDTQSLCDLESGDVAVIALPGDTDPEAVIFLDQLGVRPGVEVELREKQPFDGPVVVRINGEDHMMGEALARRIQVVPLSGEAHHSGGVRQDARERSK